ncbi:MAG TPA: tetratricopeptide repeat protein, partial [Rhodothermales bacterium]|nr:tetratricopeptide repeat protein [Rhodothermales bacterium]
RAAAAAASGVMRGAQGAATAAAWADAGLLYLRLTLRAPAEQRGPIARQAIAAFQQSLALEEGADVRTHMAEAYQYDTENPMQAIVLLREVLASNPDHPEANLRLGLMRVQIGRTEDAAESFRRVLARTQPGDPLYQQAAAQLQALGRAPIPG